MSCVRHAGQGLAAAGRRGPHSRSCFLDDGALVSTPADGNRFFGALLDGRLLPGRRLPAIRLTVPVAPDRVRPGARYGLGLISTPLPCGGTSWGPGGAVPGVERAERDVRAVVNTAFCAPTRTDHLKETP
ncbi:hypothetical protein AT728_24225 [Streptomyces silvensis]|uniref:Uncharacterized protein n=1 Tax=Streptomyces silvensis TaxID=1765722 RepID=A0A0W7X2M6_9ACTN|nr:hypothetical protein AT728_24225 [Streptomyces silvensis]